MAVCPRCGQENPEGFRFCGACATPLQAEPASREERKVVTVLFADLVGFTSRAERLDPEDVRGLVAPYFARVREELERFGGTVEKFIGDAVMALFGAPVAHEDDPERAVRAALAIRDWIAEQEGDLQVRIAVTTGEALVALGARPAEGEGMASGDVVNTAARLQTAAPVNGVLVDVTTYRATRQAIEYREAGPVEAKGKAEAIEVWEPLQARSRFGVDVVQTGAPLVGRGRELELLLGTLGRVREERSAQLLTLVGEPGIGKSRLVSELFETLTGGSELMYWRQGRSLPYGEGVTFWALAEMVKAHAGILETDSPDEAAAKLANAVADAAGSDVEWVERHLRPLVGLASDRAPAGGEARGETFAAWRRFFESLAERYPLVLVFEDLHWADDDLLDFVDYLVVWAGGVPLLVIGTARPELLERRPGWGGGKRNASTLSLSPLSDEETARLIGLLGEPVLPAEQQRELLGRAGGNPLYAEHLVRMLSERGAAEELPLPETVQGIIAARLDGLGRDEKRLLQDAAVIGKVFWTGAAAAVGGIERWSVDERLHTLERGEFVQRAQRSSVADETEYAFRHLLVRDVAYGQIPRAERAEKHRLAAAWIESLGRAEDHAEMVAHHYLSALEYTRASGQDPAALAERARVALAEAGDRALALNAYPAAARLFSEALELWPEESPERARVLFGAGKARWCAEMGGLDLIEEALEAFTATGDLEAAAEAATTLASANWYRGDRDAAYRYAERAIAVLEGRPPSPAQAYAIATRARFAAIAADPAAHELAGRTFELARELGLHALRANALNTRGIACLNSADPAGLEDLERSLALALEINSPLEMHRAYNNIGAIQGQLGRLDLEAEMTAAARETAERFGLLAGVRFTRGGEIATQFLRGRWEEAEGGAEELIAGTEAGLPDDAAFRRVRTWLRIARGDLEGALEDSARAIELSRQMKDSQSVGPSTATRALALLAAGRGDDAGLLLHDASVVEETIRVGSASGTLGFAWAFAALGRGEEFVRVAESANVVNAWLEPAVAIARGELVRAAELLGQMGAVSDEACARLWAAEALAAEGRRAEADAQLAQALAFYRSVEATAYVRRGEALLAASA